MSETSKIANTKNTKPKALIAAGMAAISLLAACSESGHTPGTTSPTATTEAGFNPDKTKADMQSLIDGYPRSLETAETASEAGKVTYTLLHEFLNAARDGGLASVDGKGQTYIGTVNGFGDAAGDTQTSCAITEMLPDQQGEKVMRVEVDAQDFKYRKSGKGADETTRTAVFVEPSGSIELAMSGPYTGGDSFQQTLDDSYAAYKGTTVEIYKDLVNDVLPGILIDNGCASAKELNPLMYTLATSNDPVRGVSGD